MSANEHTTFLAGTKEVFTGGIDVERFLLAGLAPNPIALVQSWRIALDPAPILLGQAWLALVIHAVQADGIEDESAVRLATILQRRAARS
jgi:hypothetical protein